MPRGRRKKDGGIGGIIVLLIIFYALTHIGKFFALIFGLGVAALLFFLIRAIVKATKENADETSKTGTVDVRTQGTYPKQTVRTNATSTSNYTVPKRPQPQQQAPSQPQPRPQPVKKEPVYPPEVQAVVDEGRRAHTELEHLYATIPDLAVKAKIRELIDVSDKITEDAIADPSDVPQIRKFQEYYLPTTIKLLNAYDRMGAQGIEGENISSTMQSIEEMLDTAVAAYKKLLDSLFANQALDVETDIQVMNTMLQREGLAGEGLPGFGKR